MEASKPLQYQFRFRHLDGDIGPLPFQPASSVADMKTSCLDSWPAEGGLKEKVCIRRNAKKNIVWNLKAGADANSTDTLAFALLA